MVYIELKPPMEYEYSAIGQPPVDDTPDCVPLRCYGRGLPLIPLKELPIFQHLKKLEQLKTPHPAIANGRVPSGIGRGRMHSRGSSLEESSQAGVRDVVSSYWRRQEPLRTASLDAGLKPLTSASLEKTDKTCRPPGAGPPSTPSRGRGSRSSGKQATSEGPATSISGGGSTGPKLPFPLVFMNSSQVSHSSEGASLPTRAFSRGRGIPDSWKRYIQRTIRQPGRPQPSNSGARPHNVRDTSGQSPSSPHHPRMSPSSQQPAVSKPRQGPSFPQKESFQRSARAPGAGRQAKGQSRRSTFKPIKKGSFDPDTFTHAFDLSGWAESFSYVQPHEQTTESGTELAESDDDYLHQRVPFEQDSVYESCLSSSGSSTNLVYETAVETTPGSPSDVSRAATPVPDATTTVLDSAPLVPDAVTPALPAPHAVAALLDAATPAHHAAAVPTSANAASVSATAGPDSAPDDATAVFYSCTVSPDEDPPAGTAVPATAASDPEKQKMSSSRGTKVLIKGLPKTTTQEFVYYNTASFAAIDDIIITADGEGACAEIILTKPYSGLKLCQCLQSALDLEGRSSDLKFSCLEST